MREIGERRSAARRRTLKGAHIAFNGGRSTITCLVRNLSATGALLRVESVLGVPQVFTLVLDDGNRHQCRMVRWTATEIGVEFPPAV